MAQRAGVVGIGQVGFEGFGGRVKPVQPVACAQPQRAGAVLGNGPHGVVAEAVGIIGVVFVDRKLIGGFVVFVQAAGIGAKPEGAIFGFVAGHHRVVAQTVRVFVVVAVNGDVIAIKFVNAVQCAEPHQAVVILRNIQHRRVGQPIFNGDVFKARRVAALGQQRRGRCEKNEGKDNADPFCIFHFYCLLSVNGLGFELDTDTTGFHRFLSNFLT